MILVAREELDFSPPAAKSNHIWASFGRVAKEKMKKDGWPQVRFVVIF